MFIGINGGVADLRAAKLHLAHVDGVMLGRAAYQNPAVLTGVDSLAGDQRPEADLFAVARRMMIYAQAHCAAGGRLAAVTRHMIGLFQGRPGARLWRQILTVEGSRAGAGPEVIGKALDAVSAAGRLDEAA